MSIFDDPLIGTPDEVQAVISDTMTDHRLNSRYLFFQAIPSFLDYDIYNANPSSFPSQVAFISSLGLDSDNSSNQSTECSSQNSVAGDFRDGMKRLIDQSLFPDAARTLEKWVMHDLVRLVLGCRNTAVPRFHFKKGSRTVYFYDYYYLRHWLPVQAHLFYKCLDTHDVRKIVSQYEDACYLYNEVHKSFQILNQAVKVATNTTKGKGKKRNRQDDSITNPKFLWQWLFCYQMVGEHLGHFLHHFGESIVHELVHKLGYKPNDLGNDFDRRVLRLSRRVSRDWGYNDGLTNTLIFCGRCPCDVPYISSWSEGTLSASQLYLSYSLDSRHDHDDWLHGPPHASCTFDYCEVTDLDTATYEQKHVISDCDCDLTHEAMSPDITDIEAAIISNMIPLLVVVRNANSSITLQVVSYTRGMKYIAISHVWSDGRGNPYGNSLLNCQLNLLYDICGLEDGTPIWMDTLCIPYEDGGRPCRSMAIAMMNDIYLNANRVIVLSKDLLSLPSNQLDLWVAVQMSQWMRRCWTLQEGIFAGKRIEFAFHDKLIDLRWTAVPAPYSLQSPIYRRMLDFLHLFSKTRYSTSNEEMPTITYRNLREFQWRTTKWNSDQPVIFAGLQGLDVKDLLAIPWSEDCADKRLALVYRKFGKFPTAVLYSRVARMKSAGLGWAPRCLQIPGMAEWPKIAYSISSAPVGDVNPDGICFWAHFIHLELPEKRYSLPKRFKVILESSASGIGGPISLIIDIQDVLPHHKQDANRNWIMEPGRATSSDPTRQFGLVLAMFDHDLASNWDFETPAFVVRLPRDNDIKNFKSHCNQIRNPSLLKRFAERFRLDALTGWPPLLHATYDTPANARSSHVRNAEPGTQERTSSCEGGDDDDSGSSATQRLTSNQEHSDGYRQLYASINRSLHDFTSTAASQYDGDDTSPLLAAGASSSIFADQRHNEQQYTEDHAWEHSKNSPEEDHLETFAGVYPGGTCRIVVG